ncbi:MAG: phosphatidylglycerophosphatase A [Candidatus Makaraimicrobium thalassicum]|nr:MAG: phosphatidylglycerophosphatase A [Candidatus Omnitrophota bacterium]
MGRAHNLIATVFGIGRISVAPGTWGSLAGLALCLFLHGNIFLYVFVFLTLFAAGVISAGRIEAETGRKDPPSVIIDEFACIFAVFLFVPLSPLTILTGFILYRIIDIVKPPPIRSLENLPGGWGIMLDDLAAALYTNLLLQLITRRFI